MIRTLLIFFNAAAVTFLVYHLLRAIRKPMARFRKTIIIVSGIILLLAPFGMFMRLYPAFGYLSAALPRSNFLFPVSDVLREGMKTNMKPGF
jgi:hypothetical protein